jgi:putative PIN family toxin of toxin-antitoxin system
VVYIQALISGRGPAAACIGHALAGRAVLFLSGAVLAEIRDVPLRPEMTRRYAGLTSDRVNAFVRDVTAAAVFVPTPPKVFALPRDPKDEPYIDLAIDVNAVFLVTWNERHLTYLMKRDTPEGEEFCRRFPDLAIVSPPSFLKELSRGYS